MLDELIEKISSSHKYDDCVFEVGAIFFVLFKGKIVEMLDEVGCSASPRGGSFPTIFYGPSNEQKKYIKELQKEYGFTDSFLYEILEDSFSSFGEFDEDEIIEKLEEENTQDMEIFNKIINRLKTDTNPFISAEEFFLCLDRIDLDCDTLYYKYDGYFIDLFENVLDCGSDRGEHEDYTDEEWIAILNDLDRYKVAPRQGE